ncbi:hypothetical protein F4778DRAFT_759065 [Xylariomycetidae sp. FL2044]|nr:hypothetical protein F4778DRAFT_759065 [Xylariomycetidae sp. FL2044]
MAVIIPLEKQGQAELIIVPAVFSLVSVVAVGLRIVARRIANRALDLSDYTIIVACIFSVAFSGIIMAEGIVGGGGWHVEELAQRFGLGTVERFLKISVAVQIMWTMSLSLCKCSILILYCKIFDTPTFKWLCYTTGAIIACWSLSTILSALLICQPVSDLWAMVPTGHCGDHVLSYTVTGSINIVTDVVVLILPLPYLLRLNMALYKKLVLTGTFTVGLFVCVISALRLHSIRSIDFTDITFTVAEAQVWSALEPALAITLACIPILRPLLGRSYSATGTALGGNQKRTGRKVGEFAQLDENSSDYQLSPYGPRHAARITAKFSDSRLRNDTMDNGIGVRSEWRVETQRAHTERV